MIRQTHRWLSIAFTLTVIAISRNDAGPTSGVGDVLAVAPARLLLLNRLFCSVLPHASNWRTGHAHHRNLELTRDPNIKDEQQAQAEAEGCRYWRRRHWRECAS